MTSEYAKRRRRTRRRVLYVIWFAVVAVSFRATGITSVRVDTGAMAPILLPGDFLLTAPGRVIERGSVVLAANPLYGGRAASVFRPPILRRSGGDGTEAGRLSLFIVAARAGDTVTVGAEGVRVFPGEEDNTELEPLFFPRTGPVPEAHHPGLRQLTVSEGNIFLVAADGSYLDSRHFGTVRRGSVTSVVRFVLWPFDRFGPV